MNQSVRAIVLRIGIIGIIGSVANMVAFVTSVLFWIIPLITILVGFLATKAVFEKTKHSENPPTFWGGALIGMISGMIANSLGILFYGLSILSVGGSEGVVQGMFIFVACIYSLIAGVSIILSTITGGVTATKLLRKPH